MTKQELADQLNGREYLEEITDAEAAKAKDAGLVVIFGYSDDNVEFRGAINDEVSRIDGGDIFLERSGPLEDHEDCECEYCCYQQRKDNAEKIQAIWSEGDYSWQFRTDLPYASFDIMEGTEKFCRGIVIDVNAAFAF